MIRRTRLEDESALLKLVTSTGLFESDEIDELAAMFAEHHQAKSETVDVWLTFDDGGPSGVAYYAPERMTVGTWNLYLLAVHPNRQRQGVGKALVNHVVDALSTRGARVLLVETAGTGDFDYVRAFYRNIGFAEEARIREFYAAGVDKVVYRRQLK